ncbi:MAG: M20/M25/M40 family metallo-hydrolase [Acidobacteriia bacterium]|nr:M20/M25/M40 family metallo-hydrolase [Terriglobia bacterium]
MKTKVLAFGTMALAACSLLAADAPDGTRWWSYVQFLASDKLEGRNTGSEGHRKAAEFVAAQFERDGLKPAGKQGYIQPVKFNTLQLDESASSLLLSNGDESKPMELGEDAIIGTRVDPAPSVEAGLVFVGYGLRAPDDNYDDFAELDTKGKIAVYIAGAPSSMSSALAAHYQSAAQRWAALRTAGMIGAIFIANPHHMDIPWPRVALNRFQMTMQLAEPGMDETEGEQIGVTWNPAHAQELFEGSGHTFDELVAIAETGKQLPRFALQARLKARTAVKRGSVESQNLAAIYPGSDAKLKDEYVVMSAHIDHLGIAKPINGDPIYNGAMDNAAGVASILEVADHLKEANIKTKRSIMFVVVTGEEKGLLGSRYFAVNPTVPARSIVADINTDMYLPLYPLKIVTVYGLDESTIGDDARAVAAQMEIKAQPDPNPARNVFIRSDQYSFVRQGIPSVMLDFGNEKGSPEEAIAKKWLTERYHAPSDDLEQPVDKQAAAQFNLLVEGVIERVANADARPAWKPNSFFRRYASN